MTDPSKLVSIQDIVEYWKNCIKSQKSVWDTNQAGDMVDVMHSPIFEKLLEGPSEMKQFRIIWEYAGQLELPEVNHSRKIYGIRAYQWKRIKKLLNELAIITRQVE